MDEAALEFARYREGLIDLSGKTAYISGAGTGHGLACARLFASAGAAIYAGHQDRALANKTVDLVTEAGGTAVAGDIDLRSEQSIAGWFEAGHAFGPPDILINAAMHTGAVPLIETDMAFWERMHAINLRGPFIAMREAIKQMVERGQGGVIINITTVGGIRPVRFGNAAYNSSRAGLNILAQTVAYEHAKDGIRANTLAPGRIYTEDITFADPRHNPGLPTPDDRRFPSGAGKTLDIAGAALFLASPGGAYINGQCLAVDGGFMVT